MRNDRNTIRLDMEVIFRDLKFQNLYKIDGPHWQRRINESEMY